MGQALFVCGSVLHTFLFVGGFDKNMNITSKYHRYFILLLCLLFVSRFPKSSSADTTGTPNALYDPCQATRQMFTINLSNQIVIPAGTGLPCGQGASVLVSGNEKYFYDFWFLVRKCNDNSCQILSDTNAYPYSISFADGKIYPNSGVFSNNGIEKRTSVLHTSSFTYWCIRNISYGVVCLR